MTDKNSDINKIIILKKYKHDIENSIDYSFLQGVIQAVLGFHDTKFVKDNIEPKHFSVLNGKEELLTTIVAQNMAIGQLKREIISASNKLFLNESDFKVNIDDVIKLRDSFSKEDISKSTARYRSSIKSKSEIDEIEKQKIQDKNSKKGRRFI